MDPSERPVYLEMSDPDSGSHKFYEVRVEGDSVTTRFGRIGTSGQVRTASYASPEEALEIAGKKVREKLSKGYAAATPGTTAKQPVAKRGAAPGARVRSRFYFEDLPEGAADYPTSDGRVLRFDTVEGYEASCEWGLQRFPSRDDELPTDGVECRVWVPDAEGRVWTAASRLSASYFYDELARAQMENTLLGRFDAAPAEVQALFESSLVLEGARFASDDRSYRTLWGIGKEPVEVIFKYTTLTFDVAVERGDGASSSRVYTRLREGANYEAEFPLEEAHTPDDLPALVFELEDAPGRMLRANGAYPETHSGSWEEGLFSKAVVFEPTDARGEPNEHVYARPAA